jgi:hypothetical protein
MLYNSWIYTCHSRSRFAYCGCDHEVVSQARGSVSVVHHARRNRSRIANPRSKTSLASTRHHTHAEGSHVV